MPEIASRAHLEALNPVVARAVVEAGIDESRIDAVACTIGPGLIGALLVGVSAAKALSLAWDVPFVGVNHLEAHCYSAFLEDPALEFPLVVLLVSGGHTMLVEMRGHGRYRLLGQTIDDAAGEAFDKVARFLGLGYPGGPAIDKAALRGDPEAIALPAGDARRRARLQLQRPQDSRRQPRPQAPDVTSADVAASFQAAVVDVLVVKAGAPPTRSEPPASCSVVGWRRTRCCARSCWVRAPPTVAMASCRAARCAPTTRR